MQTLPLITIFNKKSDSIRRSHPWVFSGAIKSKSEKIAEGDLVEIKDENERFLAIGHYALGSIAVRIISFEPLNNLTALWESKITAALAVRKQANLVNNEQTNAYRLINAEGDGLPGLIVDWYNGTAVLQAHSLGMYRERESITTALKAALGNTLKAVYDKSKSALHNADSKADEYLFGKKEKTIIKENGLQFIVDWEQGQKTGMFLDQRENRLLLSRFCEGKKVLNTFCYSGGFSVYADHAKAAIVHSVDSSAKATEWTKENLQLNAPNHSTHEVITEDVMAYLKNCDNDYDVIILDPPAFAKNISARHRAIQAYKRLNKMGLDKIKKGGIIFTFSCSQAVDAELFRGAVTAAAIESGKNIRILQQLTQPADHPVSIFHPEGHYLKGLVLMVE